MEDDLKPLGNKKKKLLPTTENVVDIKQTPRQKPANQIRFIITKNKNSSWVDDLHALEQLNLMDRVYH